MQCLASMETSIDSLGSLGFVLLCKFILGVKLVRVIYHYYQVNKKSFLNRAFFSGGIIGLGEADEDRVGLLHTLATLPEHPESVPINALLAVKGTPLENQKVICL